MPLWVKIAVAAGMLAFLFSFIPGLQLYMGGCFFEGVCNEHETLAIPFALGIAGAATIFAGFVAGALVHLVTRSRRR